MSNLTGVTKYFPTVNEGFITTVGAGGVSSGGATVPLTLSTGLTNGSTFVGVIEINTPNQQTFTGTVDTTGNQITGVKWTRGSNVAHAAGVSIVDIVTGTAINMMSKGFLVQHNADGTHGALSVPTVTTTGAATLNSVVVTTTLAMGGVITNTVANLASGATLTPTASNAVFECTALAVDATIAAPTGSPVNMQGMMIRIKDNGTSRALTWNAIYRGIGITLPTSTNASQPVYISMRYNSTDTKWDVLSVGRG